VATVRQLAGTEYQVTMTEIEFDLVMNALDEAERVSRFGIQVLDEADAIQEGGPSENSRLRREIEALTMREASLKSLQTTMTEIERAWLAPVHHPDLDQAGSAAAVRVPPPR
jgi:hypothetical protein